MMKKKFSFLILSALLTMTSFTSSLIASPTPTPTPSTDVQSTRPSEAKPDEVRHKPCKKCGSQKKHAPLPYKKLTIALEVLKDEKLITAEQVKNIYKVLMKIPPELVEKAFDKDKFAAETLYKEQALTEEQYNKILELLQK